MVSKLFSSTVRYHAELNDLIVLICCHHFQNTLKIYMECYIGEEHHISVSNLILASKCMIYSKWVECKQIKSETCAWRLPERESCFKKSGNGSVTKVTGADWDNFVLCEGKLLYRYIIMYYIISWLYKYIIMDYFISLQVL